MNLFFANFSATSKNSLILNIINYLPTDVLLKTFILLFICSINACKLHIQDNYHKIPILPTKRAVDKQSLAIEFNEVIIPPSQILHELGEGRYFSHAFFNDSSYLLLNSCQNKQLDIYNLSHLDASFSIDMSHRSTFCETSNSYQLYQKNILYEVLGDGDLLKHTPNKIEKICNLNDHSLLKKNGLRIHNHLQHYNEIYLKGDSLLFFPLMIDFIYENKKYSKHEYGYPVNAQFNLKTQQMKFVGINYPKLLVDNDYGFFNVIHREYFDNKIIYNFPGIPEIWEYDLTTDSLTRHNIKSSFQTDTIRPIHFERNRHTRPLLVKHIEQSARYDHLIYNKAQNLFYLFFMLPLSEKNEEGLFHTKKDRRYAVMVLDDSFTILAEQLLPDDYWFLFFTAPSKKGLVVNYNPLIDVTQNGIKMLEINASSH